MPRLIDERLAGRPASATTPFEQRESALRAVGWDDLLTALTGTGLARGFDRLGAIDVVSFTGWDMDAQSLRRHVRSELTLHRWDLVGSDDTSVELLSDPHLTSHALAALSCFGTISERAAARTWRSAPSAPLDVRLRVDGLDDVVLRASGAETTLELAPPQDGPGIETDAAARLLMLWGRRPPQDRHLVTSTLGPSELRALERWLYR